MRFIRRLSLRWADACLLTVLLAGCPQTSLGAPVTFITALPVAENQLFTRFYWNSTFGSQSFMSYQLPFDLAYGLNARWTIFTTFNPLYASIQAQTPSGQSTVSTGGFADTRVFARYTLFSRDTPKSTLRIAPLAGLFLPSGSNTLSDSSPLFSAPIQITGSGSVDPYGGVAFGWNGPKYGLAADSTFRHNAVAHAGFTPGDQFRVDGQSELRLYPMTLPDSGLPKELWLSVEENYRHDSLSHLADQVAPGSGGSSFYEDTILEYATLHFEIGAGLQVPVMLDLNSPDDVREKRRVLFFTEYYFSGFSRHRQ